MVLSLSHLNSTLYKTGLFVLKRSLPAVFNCVSVSNPKYSNMVSLHGRALHYVFKVTDRKATMDFYRKVLGMKVLRHEEFKEGCEAQCNGAYAGRWSKTMVGYGIEDENFVIELTYNYGVKSYEKGNDFIGITIQDTSILKRAKEENYPVAEGNVLEAPGGYQYFIVDETAPADKDRILKVSVASSNLAKSKEYWNGILGLKLFQETDKSITVGFDEKATKLELVDIGVPVDRKQAYGRIAFSIPHDEQVPLSNHINKLEQTVHTPLISLPTAGKETVRVIILADPDGLEICFVDDEPFRKLSEPDYASERVLDVQIQKDKS